MSPGQSNNNFIYLLYTYITKYTEVVSPSQRRKDYVHAYPHLRGFEALNSQVFSSLYAYLETVDN